MTRLVQLRHAAFHTLAEQADTFVAVSEWVRNVMIVNNVPSGKIMVSRQGIEWDRTPKARPSSRSISPAELTIAFVGRFDPTKGLHVLIRGVRLARTAKLKLDIYGVVQSQANAGYRREMLDLAKGDDRICFRDPIPSSAVVTAMHHYDFVAVPSGWLETGPLVALEAFAAGTPVIGWNAGGLAELVRDGQNGILLRFNTEEEWSAILTLLAADPVLKGQIKARVTPPRTGEDVANDMMALYSSLLTRSR